MKVYISGAITNDPNYKKKFRRAEKLWEKKGVEVVNPAKNKGENYKEYIETGIFQLMNCNTIYMLKGWEDSKGARLEHRIAEKCGYNIIYEKDNEKKRLKRL